MPQLTVYRKATTPLDQQIAVGSYRQGFQDVGITLFPKAKVTKANVDLSAAPELMKNIRDLEARGVIGWAYDNEDVDPDSRGVVYGLDITQGSTPNTTSAYYISIGAGKVRLGAHTAYFPGGENIPVLAASLASDKELAAPTAVADGNALKVRWYVAREYFQSSQQEFTRLVGIAGPELLDADSGAVSDFTKGYPSDAEVEATLARRDAALPRFVIDKIEVARTKSSRSSSTVVNEIFDLKELETEEPGVAWVDKEIGHEDIAAAATTATVNFGRINGMFLGASLQTLEASDLVSLTIELGRAGQTDELFDAFEVGTGGTANGLGLQATVPRGASPVLPNSALVNYLPALLFTGGVDLNTATTGKWRVRLWYLAEPQLSTEDGVFADRFDENTL